MLLVEPHGVCLLPILARSQCYRNGDLMAHSHELGEWTVGFTETHCPVPWTSYLHVELGLRNPDVCLGCACQFQSCQRQF